MSAVYDLPKETDFYEADILRLLQPPNAHFSIEQIRKGMVNMKMVVDFREFKENIVVFDQSKNEEYTKAMDEWTRLHNQSGSVQVGQSGMSISTPPAQPQPPIVTKTFEGTVVIYVNGQERVIMTPVIEWEQDYFTYLKKKALDI